MTEPAAVVDAVLGQFAPVWLAVAAAAEIVIGSAAAVAGWPVAARLRERHGQRWTAERLLPGAELEPVGGAVAAALGGERQAKGGAGGGIGQ